MTVEVLIGTDGSDDAIAAAQRALKLLAPADTVHVVCVVEPPAAETAGLESGFAGGMMEPSTIDVAWDELNAEAQAALDRTVAVLETSASVQSIIEVGGAGPVLCDVAGRLGVDVVAVGSRGRGAIRRALLGSVSTHVVHNAPCPVIVVRAGAG
jgi:nucleotide-binding universal stress UspA family protein